jgi:nucleotide-binding universal stress UspA family protein
VSWRRVVVGVDFSEASLAAARWVASDFAPDAEIVLVHVVATPALPSYVPTELRPSSDGLIAVPPALYGGLRGLADLIRKGRCRVRLPAGRPAEALVQTAQDVGADLICVGRGRRRRGGARFGATTSQRVLARSHLPTLIVPPVRLTVPSLVLAAVDDRTGGRRVFDVAGGIAGAHEAHVECLHVIEKELLDFIAGQEPFHATDDARPYGEWASPDGAGAWLRRRAHDWVVAEMQDAETGRHGASLSVQLGDAGHQILRHAGVTQADLIVMGRGGTDTGSGQPVALVGSTARMVAWAAPCPTLFVPVEPALRPRYPRQGPARHGALSSPSNGGLAS